MHCTRLAALGCALFVCPSALSAPMKDGPQPCPPLMEHLCSDAPGGSSGEGNGPCLCGEGQWNSTRLRPRLYPEVPVVDSQRLHANLTSWSWNASTQADQAMAMASLQVTGRSHLWASGSLSRGALAYYQSIRRDQWQGHYPACPRVVQLVATGGASLHISASTAARQGCSAFASASAAGACSSLGDASASITDLTISGRVGYSAANSSFAVDGNFGPLTYWLSESLEGAISTTSGWTADGQGSHSGSASVTVLPDRTYCAFTNRPYQASSSGQVIAGGAGTVDNNGSVAFSSLAIVTLAVP